MGYLEGSVVYPPGSNCGFVPRFGVLLDGGSGWFGSEASAFFESPDCTGQPYTGGVYLGLCIGSAGGPYYQFAQPIVRVPGLNIRSAYFNSQCNALALSNFTGQTLQPISPPPWPSYPLTIAPPPD